MDLTRLKPKSVDDPEYCRGYLPHIDCSTVQFITFRLADSLPKGALEKWRAELGHLPDSKRKIEEYRRVEAYVDRGLGDCVLLDPIAAGMVEAGIVAKHQEAYDLLAWVVMPNHVHFLARVLPCATLDSIIRELKGRSSRAINLLRNQSGTLWSREFFDRFMRNGDHLRSTAAYIHRNPVKAGLCLEALDFSFSSFRRVTDYDNCGFLVPQNLACTFVEESRTKWESVREACRLKSAVQIRKLFQPGGSEVRFHG